MRYTYAATRQAARRACAGCCASGAPRRAGDSGHAHRKKDSVRRAQCSWHKESTRHSGGPCVRVKNAATRKAAWRARAGCCASCAPSRLQRSGFSRAGYAYAPLADSSAPNDPASDTGRSGLQPANTATTPPSACVDSLRSGHPALLRLPHSGISRAGFGDAPPADSSAPNDPAPDTGRSGLQPAYTATTPRSACVDSLRSGRPARRRLPHSGFSRAAYGDAPPADSSAPNDPAPHTGRSGLQLAYTATTPRSACVDSLRSGCPTRRRLPHSETSREG